MYIPKTAIESAKKASLADYFIQNGYETEQKRNELHIKNYLGLYVNTTDNSWFQFGTRLGGKNPIDCLTEVVRMDFQSAVLALNKENVLQYDPIKSPKQKETELQMPDKADGKYKNVFAYLSQERKINPEIISEFMKKNLLYQDKNNNAIFVHRDENGKEVGAEIQGTNSFKRFKGICPGTNENVFVFKIGEQPKKAYVFESAIDLMAFYQLANKEKLQNSMLISMGGLKPKAIKGFETSGVKIISCVDNDEAGKKFNEDNGFKTCNEVLKKNDVKDWNELLKKISLTVKKNILSEKEKPSISAPGARR